LAYSRTSGGAADAKCESVDSVRASEPYASLVVRAGISHPLSDGPGAHKLAASPDSYAGGVFPLSFARISSLSGLVMHLRHQRLQWVPANFAKISVVVRHELLAAAGAVDARRAPTPNCCAPRASSNRK
jgi:hypothetical protein